MWLFYEKFFILPQAIKICLVIFVLLRYFVQAFYDVFYAFWLALPSLLDGFKAEEFQ